MMTPRQALFAFAIFGLAAGNAVAADKDGPLKWTVAGDEQPDTTAWTEPASFTYTKSSKSGEAIALDLALRADGRISDASTTTWFSRLVAHRNTETDSEQEAYAGELGAHFEWNSVPPGSVNPVDFNNAAYVFTDVSLGYNYATTFPDLAKPPCTVTPSLPACGVQHQESVRLTLDVKPYYGRWEQTHAFYDRDGDGKSETDAAWMYSFSPVISLFRDEVTQAVLSDTGVKQDGGVSGAKLRFGLALGPPVLDHRLTFRASLQSIQAFDRSSARRDAFPASSGLFKASIDYDFGKRSFESGKGFSPSIGISYSKGRDPLAGRADEEIVSVGLRLAYKAK